MQYGLALGLAMSLGGAAQAQPLMPNPGLSSLLQPQRLDRSRPLVSPDRSAGTQSGLQPVRPGEATPCERGAAASPGGAAAASTGPSLFGSGSGPGGYGRYMPGAPPAGSGTTSSSATTPQPGTSQPGANRAAATADRPLYGGVDRPLWDSGERRSAAASGSAPGKTASAAQATRTPAATAPTGTAPAGAGPVQPNALPAPVRDRPLWAESSLSGLPAPLPGPASGTGTATGSSPGAGPGAEAAIGGGGYAAAPCTAAGSLR